MKFSIFWNSVSEKTIENVEPCLESVMEGVELISRTSEPFWLLLL